MLGYSSYIYAVLLPDFSSYDRTTVDVDQWNEGKNGVGQTSFPDTFSILSSRVARDDPRDEAWKRKGEGWGSEERGGKESCVASLFSLLTSGDVREAAEKTVIPSVGHGEANFAPNTSLAELA